MKYAIGIDLGGTNARCALLDNKYSIVARLRCTTPVAQGFSAVMGSLAQLTEETLHSAGIKRDQVAGLCVASAGRIDGRSGVVLEASNLKWRNAEVCYEMEKLCGIPSMLENDANAAAYGEYCAGAGRGCCNMAMMTLGTGVGGGLVLEGRLYRGSNWTAAELGHVILEDNGRPCCCGDRGCVEAYCSATAVVQRFREKLAKGEFSILSQLDPDLITCRHIFDAAREGDRLARQVVRETAYYISRTAANLENLLNPDLMVIGGGMIQAGDFLFRQIYEEYEKRQATATVKHMKIVPASLGDDAGVFGAAGLVFSRQEQPV